MYHGTDKLFLICTKPYRPARKGTIISRWCGSVIRESGITIHNYCSHLHTAAHSLYAKCCGASNISYNK